MTKVLACRLFRLSANAYHSSDRKIRTDSLFLSVLFDIFKREDTRRNEIPRLIVVEFLCTQNILCQSRLQGPPRLALTSWKLQSSTLPGSDRPFSQANELVRSRHLASTIFPFFSLLTCGEAHQYHFDNRNNIND